MIQHFQIFDELYNNEELSNEFHKFFYTNDLLPLFTNEHRAGTIRVTWTDARSVVGDGAYAKDLHELSELLKIGIDNKKYEEAVFKILYEARSFQRMMNIIRDLIQYHRTIEEKYKHNWWNIVYYTKTLF